MMTAFQVAILRRPRRRTHLAEPPMPYALINTWCGLTIPSRDAHGIVLDMIGGATIRLRNDLHRELDTTTCKRCARIAAAMLTLYASRDTGKAA